MNEDMNYKVTIDASDVPAYLQSIKEQVNNALQADGTGFAGSVMPSGGSFIPYSMQMSSAPTPISPASYLGGYAPISSSQGSDLSSFGDYIGQASKIAQQGYYKATSVLETTRNARKVAFASFRSYATPAAQDTYSLDPIQLLLAQQGLGYNALNSTNSYGEVLESARQRMADDSIGMSDFGVLDNIKFGASIGFAYGGFKGAALGAIAGVATGTVNALARPFHQEAIFERNITRGLREYDKYSAVGLLDSQSNYSERSRFAKELGKRDLSVDMLGKDVGRQDIEDMFQDLTKLDSFRLAGNYDEKIKQMKDFTGSFTKIMHVFKVAKEQVGQIADALDKSGALSMYGDYNSALNKIEGLGAAARLDPSQALQMYSSGAEMLRGTGVSMGAGGEGVLRELAAVMNSLKSGLLSQDSIRQQGGTDQAALNQFNQNYKMATSPSGMLAGWGYMSGYSGTTLAGAQIAGLSQVHSLNDWLSMQVKYQDYLSTPGKIQSVATRTFAGDLEQMYKTGQLNRNLSQGELAALYSQKYGVSIDQAKTTVAGMMLTRGERIQQINEEFAAGDRRDQYEETSSWTKFWDKAGNTVKSVWRSTFQADGPGSTEVSGYSMYNAYDFEGNREKNIAAKLGISGAALLEANRFSAHSGYKNVTDLNRAIYSGKLSIAKATAMLEKDGNLSKKDIQKIVTMMELNTPGPAGDIQSTRESYATSSEAVGTTNYFRRTKSIDSDMRDNLFSNMGMRFEKGTFGGENSAKTVAENVYSNLLGLDISNKDVNLRMNEFAETVSGKDMSGALSGIKGIAADYDEISTGKLYAMAASNGGYLKNSRTGQNLTKEQTAAILQQHYHVETADGSKLEVTHGKTSVIPELQKALSSPSGRQLLKTMGWGVGIGSVVGGIIGGAIGFFGGPVGVGAGAAGGASVGAAVAGVLGAGKHRDEDFQEDLIEMTGQRDFDSALISSSPEQIDKLLKEYGIYDTSHNGIRSKIMDAKQALARDNVVLTQAGAMKYKERMKDLDEQEKAYETVQRHVIDENGNITTTAGGSSEDKMLVQLKKHTELLTQANNWTRLTFISSLVGENEAKTTIATLSDAKTQALSFGGLT